MLAALGAGVLIVAILAIAGVFSTDDDESGAPAEGFGATTTTAPPAPPRPRGRA